MRRVRDLRESLVAFGLRRLELLLRGLQLLLHLLHLRELLRRRLALQLRLAPQLVDPRHERAPALVRLEHRVEGLGGALPRERGAVAVGVVARCLEVDHLRESRKASIACATPSSSGPGQIQSASSFRDSSPFSTQTPKPGPREQLPVVLAVAERHRLRRREAEVLGDEREPAALRDRGAGELEEVRQRLGDEEPVAKLGNESRPQGVELLGRRDDDELRRRPLEPGEQVAHLRDRDVLEVGIACGRSPSSRRRRARRRRSS